MFGSVWPRDEVKMVADGRWRGVTAVVVGSEQLREIEVKQCAEVRSEVIIVSDSKSMLVIGDEQVKVVVVLAEQIEEHVVVIVVTGQI